MTDPILPEGTDEEHRHFHEKDVELMAKLRAKLDAARQQQAADQEKKAHWMRCPKCGAPMREEELEHIKVDRCSACQGIYFDAGELDLLLKGRSGALSSLRRLFGS